MPAEDIGAEIVRKEQGDEITYGVLDPSAFDSAGGPSYAERLASRGARFRRADNRRVGIRGAMGGWDQVRSRLIGDGERPMIYFFSTCTDSIRTLPALQHDPDRPEDVNTESEDHAPDEIRYACMSRPYIKDLPKKQETRILSVGPLNQVTLDDVFEANESKRAREGRI